MVMRSWRKRKSYGFTLIELLVVISIITLLVGIMSSGIHKMAVHARSLKQKSQLKTFTTGLEFFEKRYGILPESAKVNDGMSGEFVTGAHHLAEALIGRDERGFDSKSWWHYSDAKTSDKEDSISDLYRNPDSSDADGVIDKSSMKRRIGPFVNLDDVGAFTIEEIYGSGTGLHSGSEEWNRAPVFTDVFGAKKIELANGEKVKVGSPILYYKAKEGVMLHKRDAVLGDYANINTWVYNFDDNLAITGDQDLSSGSGLPGHKGESADNVLTITKFYEMITNPKSSVYERPYNAKSYLLISAGFDGIYGTRDDVTNFDY